MNILEEFYHGNISPAERSVEKGSHYSNLSKRIIDIEDDFLQSLSEKQKEQYEKLDALLHERGAVAECDTFVYAFKLAFSFFLECFSDYNGQFRII